MKTLCDFCKHQTTDKRGGVHCGIGSTVDRGDGYGSSRSGARCVHDTDYLADMFAARTENAINVRNMSAMLEQQSIELMKARDTIRGLQERLTRIDV